MHVLFKGPAGRAEAPASSQYGTHKPVHRLARLAAGASARRIKHLYVNRTNGDTTKIPSDVVTHLRRLARLALLRADGCHAVLGGGLAPWVAWAGRGGAREGG